MMIFLLIMIGILLVSAYFRLPLVMWSMMLVISLMALQVSGMLSTAEASLLWIVMLTILIPLNLKPLRRHLLSRFIFAAMAKAMPSISQTEQEALDAGDVWWEAELFSGDPNFDMIRSLPKPSFTDEEQAFLDGPVEQLCGMLDDWKITHEDFDLSPEAWRFIKDNRFFAMIIPKRYGGLEYSALLHSEVVMKLTSASGSAAVTVMVPNSLGPAKLLLTYGTEEQKDYYLPRLASGEEIPCFGLTGPDAGSDAGAMPDNGVVCYGSYDGRDDVLGIRLNFEKRYITLAPVATLLGIAFKLYDPEHLLGEVEDIGITLALIRRETDGIQIGNRHFPANQAFMNGPVRGKDVFIPIENVIGGVDFIGRGWSMLMECLADGRAISLPAMSTSAGKIGSKYTGAYARIRKQFRTPIGKFEGVEEALAVIGGQAYAMDAARLLTLSALDHGEVPSVVSGIVKQQLTERMRKVVNAAMDIHGGHGICMGPHNFLGRAYQIVPVGITVEGANILTRNMIIFGQGALRSHPYLLKEVEAFQHEDRRIGLMQFDDALFAHMGFMISNMVRSLWLGLTGARFVSTPGHGKAAYYYRQLVRMSTSFALVADLCVITLGGSLKRKEMISGRLADTLSNLYILSAALKKFEDDNAEEDTPLLSWVAEDALYTMQQSLKGVMTNLPLRSVGVVLNALVFPLTKPYQQSTDSLTHDVASILLEPNASLGRLSDGAYSPDDPDHALGRITYARRKVLAVSEIEGRIKQAQRAGTLPKDGDFYGAALECEVIDQKEYDALIDAQHAVANAIKVDEFSDGWKLATPASKVR